MVLSLCMITKKVIINNWICAKTPSEREWVTEAMEAVNLDKVAFSPENNDVGYVEIWAPMENYFKSLCCTCFCPLDISFEVAYEVCSHSA